MVQQWQLVECMMGLSRAKPHVLVVIGTINPVLKFPQDTNDPQMTQLHIWYMTGDLIQLYRQKIESKYLHMNPRSEGEGCYLNLWGFTPKLGE